MGSSNEQYLKMMEIVMPKLSPTGARALEAIKNALKQPSTNSGAHTSNRIADDSCFSAKENGNVSSDVSDTELFAHNPTRKRALPAHSATTPKAKRQKKTPQSKNSTATAKPKRKTGWRAAEDAAKNRSATERNAKQGKWTQKLDRCKNAYVKRIVQNAFHAETPVKWKGTRYPLLPAIKEKKRTTGGLGQAIMGRGMRVKTENKTAEKIQERWSTYKNDALRYAKLVSKAESFETWAKKRKMDVRARILASIDVGRMEDLADNGF